MPAPRPDRPTADRTLSPGRAALAGAALAGAAALVVATVTDVVVVTAGTRTVTADDGFARHSVALLLLAAAAVALTVLAMRSASRPAALGLAAIGAVALLLAIAGDVPDLGRSGAYRDIGLDATTEAGPGFYAETVGGALLLLAGGLLFLTARRDD